MTSHFVLVHSPLVGPLSWRPVGELLSQRGNRVSVPDLRPTLSGPPPFATRQADRVLELVTPEPTIVLAHSGAGSLMGLVGQGSPAVAGCVFVDAGLPTPSQSWLETAPRVLSDRILAIADNGWLPPWSSWWGKSVIEGLIPDPDARRAFVADCARLPVAMFEEHEPTVPGWPFSHADTCSSVRAMPGQPPTRR